MRHAFAALLLCLLVATPATSDSWCPNTRPECSAPASSAPASGPTRHRKSDRARIRAAAAAIFDDPRPMVDAAAAAAGVPLAVAHAVILTESGYRPHLRGAAGEYGLGQVKCQTARDIGFRGVCSALFDPATNLQFAMKYLRMAIDLGGAGCVGVSLYQSGIYARPLRCSAYGRRVMARAK